MSQSFSLRLVIFEGIMKPGIRLFGTETARFAKRRLHSR